MWDNLASFEEEKAKILQYSLLTNVFFALFNVCFPKLLCLPTVIAASQRALHEQSTRVVLAKRVLGFKVFI